MLLIFCHYLSNNTAELMDKPTSRDKQEEDGKRDLAEGRERGGDNAEMVYPCLGGDGRKHVLAIFPAELWTQILEKLDDDPRDILNMTNTSICFDDLVGDRKPSFRFAEILPLVATHLGTNDMLACRLVAKSVKKFSDQILDSVGRLSPFKNLDIFPRFITPGSSPSLEWDRYHSLGVEVTIKSLDQLEQFHQDMQRTSLVSSRGRPCVCRKLNLSLTLPVNHETDNLRADVPWYNEHFLERSTEILLKYRHKIHFLHFEAGSRITNPIESYEIARRLMVTLPNLRGIYGRFRLLGPAVVTGERRLVAELQRHIELNPLPEMAYLEDLVVKDLIIPTPFYQEIINRYGGTLKKLHIDSWPIYRYPEYLTKEPQQLPELLDLKLAFSWPLRQFLLQIQAPSLTSLQLFLVRDFTYGLNTPPPMFPWRMIQLFLQFPNLVHLHLHLLFFDYEVASVPLFLFWSQRNVHPNLKHLTIENMHSFMHFQLSFFGNLFPSLESIHIVGTTAAWHHSPVSNFDPDLRLLCTNRMYQSTLWSRLPNLKKFGVIYDQARNMILYTRQGYENAIIGLKNFELN